MKKVFLGTLLAVFLMGMLPWLNAQTVCNNGTGPHGNYTFEYWRDNGKGCMELGPEGTFSVKWSDTNNLIARVGVRPGIGNEIFTYAADYQPIGNSYLGVIGFSRHPSIENGFIEYYIIDSWGTWKPPGYTPVGTVETDGDIYDIYKFNMLKMGDPVYIDEHSYFSVRRTKRTSGTITIANHLKAWEALNMPLDDLLEVSFFVEGYQSSGYAHVYELSITQGEPTPLPSTIGDVNADYKIDIIDALLVTQFYTGLPVEVFFVTKADVNHDGAITIVDALLIAQCYVGQKPCDF